MLYPDAEKHLGEILKIVESCPEDYKSKCFEILLQGYVTFQIGATTGVERRRETKREESDETSKETQIPTEILQRFRTFAKRLEVSPDKLELIFDFTTDPFIYQPFTPPGGSAAEKVRSIALVLAAKTYLTTGNWSADWKEVKSLCVDHSCYISKNHVTSLQKGKPALFKTVEAGQAIVLSPDGIKQAEAIIKALAESE